jgi:hypothetical protein
VTLFEAKGVIFCGHAVENKAGDRGAEAFGAVSVPEGEVGGFAMP